jgi:hypothetical protein
MKEPKYRRTQWTTEELNTLVKFFDENPFPSSEVVELLSTKLCKQKRKVKIWFQNRRQRILQTESEQNPSISEIPTTTDTISSTPTPVETVPLTSFPVDTMNSTFAVPIQTEYSTLDNFLQQYFEYEMNSIALYYEYINLLQNHMTTT